jgi:hypothetical protein
VFTLICHCSVCQKSTGSAFTIVIGLNRSDFSIIGKCLNAYQVIGDSGKPVSRYFCNKCGTLVYAELDSSPDVIAITAGTLNDHSWVKPQMHVYWRDHIHCISEMNNIPKFDILPNNK